MTKQEPVAWMYEVNDTFILFSANKPPEDAYDEGSLIPLYTAPRELSDEEIEKLATSKMNQILMDLLMHDVGNDRRIDWNMGCTKQHLINFAKAILKKASEK